jgi:hypothetical protein
MRLHWFRDKLGNARLSAYGINESARKKPGSLPWHARLWINIMRLELAVEWSICRRAGAAFMFHIGEDDMPNMGINLGIPFIMNLWVSLAHSVIKPLVPTVKRRRYEYSEEVGHYVNSDRYWDMPITRRIGFKIFDGRLWIELWSDWMDDGNNRPWQSLVWSPTDFFFGRARYSQRTVLHEELVMLVMPEGRYEGTLTMWEAQWKRPRWPLATKAQKVSIEVADGIPIPGKGENDWDIDDDAIHEICVNAGSAQEGIRKLYDAVMRDRIKYASADWQPATGWPPHLQREYGT